MGRWIALLLAAGLMGQLAWADGPQVHGAGSTAAAAIYRGWAREYQKATGIAVPYDAIGSGAGVKKLIAHEVEWGATDVALPEADLKAHDFVLVPVGITGIVPVYNLPSLGDTALNLTGEVLKRIFQGEISAWNSQEIADLNPGVKLPDLAIKVLVRADGSGTSYNFCEYLAHFDAKWREQIGVKTQPNWPAGFATAKGSDGIVKGVQDTRGAISYVDFAYVRDGHLQYAVVKNREGEFPKPSAASFRSALNQSEWVSTGAFTTPLTNLAGKGVWPITMGTYVVLPRVVEKIEQGQQAMNFFTWGFLHGDAIVQENNFVRLPDRVQASAFRLLSGVVDKSGRHAAPLLN